MKHREKFGGLTSVVPAAEAKKLGLIKEKDVKDVKDKKAPGESKDKKLTAGKE